MLIQLILASTAIPTPSMRAAMDLGTGPVDPSMALEVGLTGESLTAGGTSRALSGRWSNGQWSGNVGRCWGLNRRSRLDVEAWGRELALVVVALVAVAHAIGASAKRVHDWERRIRILEPRADGVGHRSCGCRCVPSVRGKRARKSGAVIVSDAGGERISGER